MNKQLEREQTVTDEILDLAKRFIANDPYVMDVIDAAGVTINVGICLKYHLKNMSELDRFFNATYAYNIRKEQQKLGIINHVLQ
jgi:hypothetical protein